MATGKRFYWIKLRDSFMTSDAVDFMMSQPGGANYVVLYQMLCLKTINTGGRLSRQIGEIIIPYDVEKIRRDCKWFSTDTVRIALDLYKRFGLIYEDIDGTLVLAEHKQLVGSETDWAAKKQRQRQVPQALPDGDNVPTNVPLNVPTEIRDKDIRDKRLDIRERDIGSGNNDVVVGNPFGDDYDVGRPDPNSIEIYATSNLQYLSPYNMEELISFRDSLPDDLIRYAIDQACANGVRTYAYTKSILNNYVSSGFKCIGDVQAHEAQRRKGQQNQQNGNYNYDNEDESNPYKGW